MGSRMMESAHSDSIPDGLRCRRQWVLWRYMLKPGAPKPTKVPYQPTGDKASHSDPGTWYDFPEVMSVVPSYDGVGFVFSASDPYCGIDLDQCFDAQGTLRAWAVPIVSMAQECGCYIERTPSGVGLHVIGMAKLPSEGRKIGGLGEDGTGAIEVYDRARYFTVTGDQTDAGDASGDLTPLIVMLWDRYGFGEQRGERVDFGSAISDTEAELLVRRVLSNATSEFIGHWSGRWDAKQYPGPSEARMGLLTKIALKLGAAATPAEVQAVALRSGLIRDEIKARGNSKWPRLAQRECELAVGQAKRISGASAAPVTITAFDGAGRQDGKTGELPIPAPLEPPPLRAITAAAFRLRDPSTIEPRDWLYKRIFIRGYVTGTFAPGAAAKTQMSLFDMVTMACGFDLATREPLRRGPLTVWYINVEDDREEIERRLAAICLHYRITDAELAGRLLVDTDREGRYLVAETTRHGVVVQEVVVSAILEQVKAHKVDLVVADPLVGMHAVSENSNPEMNRVIAQLRRVAEQGNCGVHVVHHVRKGGDGEEVSAEDGRGASAIKDACRAIRTITPMSEKEAADFGISAERRRFYIWCNPSGKPNLAPPIAAREWFMLEDVGLGNGRADRDEDRIGVPVKWSPPSAFDGISLEDCRRIWVVVGSISAPLTEARSNAQSPAWLGWRVLKTLGWATSDIQSVSQIKRLLSSWLAGSVLEEYRVSDGQKGRDVPCLRLGSAAKLD
jgi:hypothetical protein